MAVQNQVTTEFILVPTHKGMLETPCRKVFNSMENGPLYIQRGKKVIACVRVHQMWLSPGGTITGNHDFLSLFASLLCCALCNQEGERSLQQSVLMCLLPQSNTSSSEQGPNWSFHYHIIV